jgi:hypothetical protein
VHAIHNARVQLGATALNNMGVAAVVAGIRTWLETPGKPLTWTDLRGKLIAAQQWWPLGSGRRHRRSAVASALWRQRSGGCSEPRSFAADARAARQ